MSGQQGRDLLIRIRTQEQPPVYETVAGLRTKSLVLSTSGVDVTHADSPDAWRELLSGGGIRSMRVTGNGVSRDRASDARLREAFFGQHLRSYEMVLPGSGTVTGEFLITELIYGGNYDGEVTFSAELSSSGPVVFAAL